ncbi:lipoprotein [Streptomyces albiaxialis]|uniref:Lipoprotein n=1 Tax=Streptomyces albiaxialis TaxID=329523 RepID=A0ABP5HC61_9ACTN
MNRIRKKTVAVPVTAAALTLGLLLAGCAEDGDGGTDGGKDGKKPPASAKKPHGYVPGAEEAAEQQSRLVLGDSDSGSGDVVVLDLIDEKTRPLGRMGEDAELVTDGRFAYAGSGGGARVFDSGAWMVDHGDHVHYYRAEPKDVGRVKGDEPRHVYSSASLTALTLADGTARIVDHARLEKGSVRVTATLDDAGRGPVVPLGENVLVPVEGAEESGGSGKGGGDTVVEVRDGKGERTTTLGEKCPGLRGAAVTRAGVVYGCADGALFVTERKGKVHAERIPFGRKVPDGERPRAFHHRSQGTTLTATAGDKGVWVLDVAEREWKLIETGPVEAVNSAGEGTPLLALHGDGTLKAYELSGGKKDGEEIASRKVLAGKSRAKDVARSVIEVDASRAYVNDTAAKKVYEIDYNDGLRKARSFSLDLTPSQMVETGR